MTKIWKEIQSIDGNYCASACGEILNQSTGEIVRQHLNTVNGYRYCNIKDGDRRRTILVHRLVAETFIPNPQNKPEANHRNGDKTDNRVENLEWCTRIENADHAKELGLYLYGDNHPRSKVKCDNAKLIKQLSLCGIKDKDLADEFGVSRTAIYKIRTGKSYQHLNL